MATNQDVLEVLQKAKGHLGGDYVGVPEGRPIYTSPETMTNMDRIRILSEQGREKGGAEGFTEGGWLEAIPFLRILGGEKADLVRLERDNIAMQEGHATQAQFEHVIDWSLENSQEGDTLYHLARTLKQLPAFGVEIWATGGVYDAGRAGAAKALSKFAGEKMAASFGGRALAGTGGVLAQQTAIGGVQTGLSMALQPRDAWGGPDDLVAMRRAFGEMEWDVADDGKIQVMMRDVGEAMADKKMGARITNFFELGTERLGPTLKAAIKKLPIGKQVFLFEESLFRWMRGKGYAKSVDELAEKLGTKAQIHSAMEEMSEEMANYYAEALVNPDTPGVLEQPLPFDSFEQAVGTMLGLAIPGAARAAAGRVTGEKVEEVQAKIDKVDAAAAAAQVDATPTPSQPLTQPGEFEAKVQAGLASITEADRKAREAAGEAPGPPAIQVDLPDTTELKALQALAQRRGADVVGFEGPEGVEGMLAGEGVLFVNKAKAEDPAYISALLTHEGLHDIGSKDRELLDRLVQAILVTDPEGFLDAMNTAIASYQQQFGKEMAPGLFLEEGAARYAQERDALVNYLGSPEGKAFLGQLYEQDRSSFTKVVDLLKKLLKRLGINLQTTDEKLLETLSQRLGSEVDLPSVQAADLLSQAFRAIEAQAWAAPSSRPTGPTLAQKPPASEATPAEAPVASAAPVAEMRQRDTGQTLIGGGTEKVTLEGVRPEVEEEAVSQIDLFEEEGGLFEKQAEARDKGAPEKRSVWDGPTRGQSLVGWIEGDLSPEGDLANLGTSTIRGVMVKAPVGDVVDVLEWAIAPERSPWVQRFIASEAASVLRERGLTPERYSDESEEARLKRLRGAPAKPKSTARGRYESKRAEFQAGGPDVPFRTFLRSHGGVRDQHGDLRHFTVKEDPDAKKGGFGLPSLVSDRGMSWDAALSLAYEAGYLRKDAGQSDINDLVDLLERNHTTDPGANFEPFYDEYGQPRFASRPVPSREEERLATSGIRTAQNVQEYILRNTPGQPQTAKVREAVHRERYYQEQDIPLASIQDPDLEGVVPAEGVAEGPIVLAADGTIIDGRHRVTAARERGDTTIRALVPARPPQEGGERYATAPALDSPAFQRMAKRMGPELKNDDGSPKVFYHGTGTRLGKERNVFTEFRPLSHFGSREAAYEIQKEMDEGRIYPVYLAIRNPLRIRDTLSNDSWHHLSEIERLIPGIFKAKYRRGEKDEDVVVRLLEEHGYDGMVYENDTEDPGVDSFIPLHPTQIKSATGNVGTYDPNNPDIRYATAPADQLGFYSQVTANAEGLEGKKFKNRLSLLKKLKVGVKDEELQWMGLDDWLRSLPSGHVVTKEELLDFIHANEVVVGEKVLGEPETPRSAGVVLRDDFGLAWDDATREQKDLALERQRAEMEAERDPAKHADPSWQEPGGENYRELLLTLPRKVPDQKLTVKYDSIDKRFTVYDEAGQAVATGRDKEEALEFAREKVREKLAEQGEWRGGHYGETPNVLAHVRFNERTDAEGNRVLFLEEIQSDWMQQGRKEGFAQPINQDVEADKLYTYRESSGEVVGGPFESENDAYYAAEGQPGINYGAGKDMAQIRRGVPDAPFKTSWPTLAFRRMVRWAAENGFDSVSWTDGEMQFNRYGSEEITWERRPDGAWDVRATEQVGGTYEGQDIGELARIKGILQEGSEVVSTKEELRSLIAGVLSRGGANVDKVTDRVWGRMQTEDFGQSLPRKEGMEAFYDRRLVETANKLGKRFGAKVGESVLPQDRTGSTLPAFIEWNEGRGGTAQEARDAWSENGPLVKEWFFSKTATVPSLPITPSMRESVVEEGFPRFAIRPGDLPDDIHKRAEWVSLEDLPWEDPNEEAPSGLAEDDEYLYHVTVESAAEAILANGFRTKGVEQQHSWGDRGEGEVYFTDLGGVPFWMQGLKGGDVAILRIPRDAFEEVSLSYDHEGSRDARQMGHHGSAYSAPTRFATAPTPVADIPGPEDYASMDRLFVRWISQRLKSEERAKSQAAQNERELRKIIGKRTPGEMVKESLSAEPSHRKVRQMAQAMHIYIDSGDKLEELYSAYEEELSDHQKRIIKLAMNLPPEVKALADRMARELREEGEAMKDAGVIRELRENYIARIWKQEDGGGGAGIGKFKQKSRHSKQRKIPTVIEGWAEGLTLAVGDAIHAQEIWRVETAQVLHDKNLVSTGQKYGILSTDPPKDEDWQIVNHPNVRTTKWAGTYEEGKDYGKNFFFDGEGNVFERQPLYAPAPLARKLNNVLGKSWFADKKGWAALARWNAILKANVLFTSLFHHQAFLRSFYFGTPFDPKDAEHWKMLNPLYAMRKGQEAVDNWGSELQELMDGGLTLGRERDINETALQEKTKIGEVIDKVPMARNIRNALVKIRDQQIDFLFHRMGPHMKVMSSLLEYRHLLSKYRKQLEAGTVTKESLAELAAKTANEDFGGLPYDREGRSHTQRQINRFLMLAPDWTESNVRTMVRAFKKGPEGSAYRRIWGRVILRAGGATILFNMLMAGMDDDDDDPDGKNFWTRQKRAWDEGNLRWLEVDITPLYRAAGGDNPKRKYFSILGHFRDPIKFILHPGRSAKHKISILGGVALEGLEGSDWMGRPFTTYEELLGVDEKGKYKTSKRNKDGTWDYRKGDLKGGRMAGESVSWKTDAGKGVIGWDQVPSYLINQTKGSMPIQVQNLTSWLAGEMDGFDAVGRSLGMMTSTTRPETVDEQITELKSEYKDALTPEDRTRIRKEVARLRRWKGQHPGAQ